MTQINNLVQYYQKIKNKSDFNKPLDKVVFEAFEYDILREKPSKKYKKEFNKAYEIPYPELVSDITPKLQKKLKQVISFRKNKKKEEDKWNKQRAEKGYADIDTWNINSWFLDIMPKMLKEMRDNLHGFPDSSVSFPNNSQAVVLPNEEEPEGLVKWKEILDRMIFLLGEMNDETCSYKNYYEKEYDKINEDFRKKYGWFGEGLKSEEELKKEKEEGSSRMYFPSDFPELYPDAEKIKSKYFAEEQTIFHYRDLCREEFFNLFSRYFWDLWD